VKLFALTSLVVGSLIANQAFAADISTQPLTREDCDKAAMARDDNANVCGSESDKAEVRPKAQLDRPHHHRQNETTNDGRYNEMRPAPRRAPCLNKDKSMKISEFSSSANL
jgi:hypothetical protein